MISITQKTKYHNKKRINYLIQTNEEGTIESNVEKQGGSKRKLKKTTVNHVMRIDINVDFFFLIPYLFSDKTAIFIACLSCNKEKYVSSTIRGRRENQRGGK